MRLTSSPLPGLPIDPGAIPGEHPAGSQPRCWRRDSYIGAASTEAFYLKNVKEQQHNIFKQSKDQFNLWYRPL
jgi:hypothetical protein